MRDILRQVCYEGGQLVGVEYALFEGSPRWIAAIALRFETLVVTFRAVEDDDTLAVVIGPLVPAVDELMVPAVGSAPWAACLGRDVTWAWVLTNQQGYVDGARLEFRAAGQLVGPVVELIVLGSAIRLLAATEVGST